MYSIKELSNLAGVSARTLRYYDKFGLLKPAHISDAGYRCYGEREVDLLQQILFYRERGFSLATIKRIIYEDNFDLLTALEEHLQALEEQRKHVESLITLVTRSILTMKGEEAMSDKEKFENFKKNIVNQHEEMYGAEARKQYGDTEIDSAHDKILNMSEADYERFHDLSREIHKRLEEAVLSGISPDSDEARRIVALHKDWLCMTWREYTEGAHRAVADMYISDERFRMYYDRNVPGCADFLEKAVKNYIR